MGPEISPLDLRAGSGLDGHSKSNNIGNKKYHEEVMFLSPFRTTELNHSVFVCPVRLLTHHASAAPDGVSLLNFSPLKPVASRWEPLRGKQLT
jgi:hypothetical protein